MLKDYDEPFMDTSGLSQGEVKALIKHGMPEQGWDSEGYVFQEMEQMFIAGYRAAIAIIENRIAWLTEEVERKPTSYPDSEAQIGHRMERNTLRTLRDRLKERGE